MKVIIVGGVAGGASCAARLRRLDEKAEIVMVERGPYVSYANCGLPYHIGGVIEKESSLLVADATTFRAPTMTLTHKGGVDIEELNKSEIANVPFDALTGACDFGFFCHEPFALPSMH